MEKTNKIHITTYNGIDDETAVSRVLSVIKKGRISKDDKLYCYASAFSDGIVVSVSDYRKSDCFSVYYEKEYDTTKK